MNGLIFLATWNSPDLPVYLEKFRAAKRQPKLVILAGKSSDKDNAIFFERVKEEFTPVSFWELEVSDIEFRFVPSHNSASCLRLLSDHCDTLVVNAGTPNIISEAVIAAAKRGIVSCHPGALPAYRGCTCVEWALFNDDPVCATCYFMDSGIDSGPIVISRPMPIYSGDSYRRVRARMVAFAVDVLLEGVELVLRKGLHPSCLPQQSRGRYYRVIPPEKLRAAVERLEEGRYSHYCESPRTFMETTGAE